jgi:hypothetical protein
MNRKNRALVFAFALCAAAGLHAQTTSRLSGSVTDSSGAAIPGASVKVLLPGASAPVAAMQTAQDGGFVFVGLNPGVFDLSIESAGFSTKVLRGLRIENARELSLPPIPMDVSTVAETVDVVASLQSVQTTNAEISNTVTNEQFRALPQLNRSVTALLQTQAGVTDSGRVPTTINGLRPAYLNITYEGVNIQDNFIRTNTADFQPLRLFTDQVAEMTITTSNSGPVSGGGAAQVNFIAPSGSNDWHGSAYWTNRNNALAANTWFNNRDNVELPFLNQNQFGGTLGGPIVRNKLFFFTNVERFMARQQQSYNRTILTETARQGIFIYPVAGGTARGNIMQITGKPFDPAMRNLIGLTPAGTAGNNFDVGDSRPGDIRNTIGYRFVTRNNQDRWNGMGKLDYYLTPTNSIAATYSYADDLTDRPDVNNGEGYTPIPPNLNGSRVNFLSIGWRTNPRSTITNEFRFGFTQNKPFFDTRQEAQPYFVGGLFFSSPVGTFLPQGRNVSTYNFNNNTAWTKGRHTLQFGVNYMPQLVNPYNSAGIVPTYTLGIGPGQTGLPTGSLPGISAAEFTRANSLLANLAGQINNASQTFNVTSRDSGFVSGADERRNYRLDTWALYFTDNYRMSSKFVLNYGIRWEYLTVFDERDALALLPNLVNGNYIESLFGNNTLDFAGKAVGRPFYNPDRNNFAPNLGIAWNPRGDGKTAIRAGYSMNFVQDSQSTAIRNSVNTNAGLAQVSQLTGLGSTLANPTAIPAPVFRVPRTFQDNFNINTQGAFGMPDPNLATPYVQQWNFSIQQEVYGGILDVRYVGNKATKSYRAFDFNQVNIKTAGFDEEFQRAYNNGIAAQRATGAFNPTYNPSIPGSVPLPLLSTFPNGGLLTNATILNLIQTQQPGELAHTYQINRILPPNFSFYQNPLSLGLNVMTNYSNASYNAFQVDYTRRFRDTQFQANYVFAKVMSDTAGDSQTQFEPFLDINNGPLERARTPYDVTHALKGNFFYELPWGKGKKWDLGWANWIVGGWGASGILTYQTGNPISIMSHRGTLNRGNRSNTQNGTTATSLLNKEQLDKAVSFRMSGTGPFIVDQAVIGSDGRGVNVDGQAPFQGQAFFHPTGGTLGTLQRRMFSGPTWFNFDFAAQKNFNITEQVYVQFRMASTNFFNNAAFYSGDHVINSVNFGRITATQTDPRRIQFELFLRF